MWAVANDPDAEIRATRASAGELGTSDLSLALVCNKYDVGESKAQALQPPRDRDDRTVSELRGRQVREVVVLIEDETTLRNAGDQPGYE
jgi:hypothetical protein